jgi:hypothetical protein
MRARILTFVGAIVCLLFLSASSTSSYAASITIFDTFGPNNTYWQGQGATISGSAAEYGLYSAAMPFTSNTPAVVQEIDLGLTWVMGASAASVALYTNE